MSAIVKRSFVLSFVFLMLPSFAFAKSLVDKHGVNLLEQDTVYTAVNLHPDNERGLLYTVNYQLSALLPRCTAVEITGLGRKKMKFRLKESNREYVFVKHKRSTPMSLGEYLGDFFTSKCDDADLKGLNKKDLAGIKTGRASVGMSKQGVLLAMGRPPHHVTPSLEHYEWMYWRNRFVRIAVTFDDNGIVSEVR